MKNMWPEHVSGTTVASFGDGRGLENRLEGESMLLVGLWTRLVLWSYLGAPAEVHIHSSKRAIACVHS